MVLGAGTLFRQQSAMELVTFPPGLFRDVQNVDEVFDENVLQSINLLFYSHFLSGPPKKHMHTWSGLYGLGHTLTNPKWSNIRPKWFFAPAPFFENSPQWIWSPFLLWPLGDVHDFWLVFRRKRAPKHQSTFLLSFFVGPPKKTHAYLTWAVRFGSHPNKS